MVTKLKETIDPKKRKVSKKTKKSWRKHVSMVDVDAFLEEKRLEERLGLPFSNRSDAELFSVDKTSNNTSVPTTKQQRRLLLKNKEPRCFNALKPHTAIPDPIAKRNTVKQPGDSKDILVKRRIAAKQLKKRTRRDAASEQMALIAKDRKLSEKTTFNMNVWTEEDEPKLGEQSEWLTSDTIRHTLSNTGQKRKRIPLSVWKKTSVLPSIEAPHPGTSYNPSYNDHQELLATVAKKEIELMKEEAHLNRVTTKMFQRVSAGKKQDDWMREMSQGLPKRFEETDQKADGEIDDGIVKSVNPPVKNAKKPLVKRRKQKEQRELELERMKAKIEKKKISDVYKLKKLNSQIAAKERKEEMLRKKREKVKAKKITEPKTLSRVKFEAPEADFSLAEELTPNLRNSKPIGSLLKDRFKSLQHRNILAPSTRVLKRNKAKVKKFEKAGHKMGWESTFK